MDLFRLRFSFCRVGRLSPTCYVDVVLFYFELAFFLLLVAYVVHVLEYYGA